MPHALGGLASPRCVVSRHHAKVQRACSSRACCPCLRCAPAMACTQHMFHKSPANAPLRMSPRAKSPDQSNYSPHSSLGLDPRVRRARANGPLHAYGTNRGLLCARALWRWIGTCYVHMMMCGWHVYMHATRGMAAHGIKAQQQQAAPAYPGPVKLQAGRQAYAPHMPTLCQRRRRRCRPLDCYLPAQPTQHAVPTASLACAHLPPRHTCPACTRPAVAHAAAQGGGGPAARGGAAQRPAGLL